MLKYITDDIEISSDSDTGDPDNENYQYNSYKKLIKIFFIIFFL